MRIAEGSDTQLTPAEKKKLKQILMLQGGKYRPLENTATNFRTGGYKNISLLWVQTLMDQAAKSPRVSEALKLATAARKEIYEWLVSYERRKTGGGFSAFWYDWKKLRLCINLQTRLLVEQVCSDLGPPWSKVVTGFGTMRL